MKVIYSPQLMEEAAFRHLNHLERSGYRADYDEYHSLADPIYELPEDDREIAFEKVNKIFFLERLKLGEHVLRALEAVGLIPKRKRATRRAQLAAVASGPDDDSGETVVKRKKQAFVKFHEEIYYAGNDKEGKYIQLDSSNHPINDKPLDLSITKLVFSMFLSIIIIFIIFILSAKSYARSKKGEPSGLGKFTEPIIIYIRDEVALPLIGEEKHEKYLPFLLTIFFFIWINNLMGMIPFFPFSANLSGNIAFTGVLALITFVITTLVSNKHYWKHIFWMPGIPVPMKLFMAPIEFLGIFIKPLSLMIRLFANISAGHIIVLSLISLIFIFKSIWVAPASLLFSVFISLIEVLVVAIQAYIFTMLSALYIGSAMEEQEH